MNKKSILIGAATIVAAFGFLTGCNKEEASTDAVQEEREIPVEVAAVSFGALSDSNLLTGTVTAENEVAVLPKAAGDVTNVMVKKGDQVKQGDVLAVLDDEAERNALQQQEASLKQAQAGLDSALNGKTKAELALQQAEYNLEQAQNTKKDSLKDLEMQISNAQMAWELAKANLERMNVLYQDGLVSKQEYENAVQAELSAKNALESAKLGKEQTEKSLNIDLQKLAVENAKAAVRDGEVGVVNAQASLEMAQLAVESARDRLDDKKIIATISGEVTDVTGEVGEMASPQSPFATIVSIDSVKIQVNILPDQLSNFNVGDEVDVKVSGIDSPIKAKITYVSSVSTGSGLFTVEAQLDNQDKKVRPGMVASIMVEEVLEDDTIIVPTESVIQKEGKSYVFVVKEGKAVQKEVEIVRYGTDSTAVAGELEENDQVVSSGQNLLEDGNSVKIMEED